MSEPEAPQGKLYTLSEISQKTGISMPTLQRYKKMYQDRIPAEGKGRKQRYPESSLPVFDELRNENLGRRGRPRKDASAPRPERTPAKAAKAAKSSAASGRGGRKAAAVKETKQAAGRKAGSKRAAAAPAPAPAARGRKAATSGSGRGNLMTLTQISEQTGISYPTLVRYVRMHADRLPHEGKGRGRRFYPEAVNVFRQLREESGRGGRKPSAAAKKVGRPAGRPVGRPPGRPAAASGRGAAAARGARTSADDVGILQRLREIEKSNLNLEKRFRDFAKSLQRLLR
jgi:predicted DNA-binding transcriptional regulator AlpA